MHELRPGLWHWEAPHRSGNRPSRGALRSRPMRSTTAGACCSSTRCRCPTSSRPSRPTARRRSCSPPHGTSATPRASWIGSTHPSTCLRRTRKKTSWRRTASPLSRQPGFVSPDVRWLLDGDSAEARLYGAGDRLPIGVEAFPGQKRNDMVLWIESLNTVIAGDTLVDWGQGLQINPRWLREDMTREQVAGQLRPLLERPVEHVLPTHGGPTDRAVLENALS